MCCLYGEKVDLSVQKFTIKCFQVGAGKQKCSASKGANIVEVRYSKGIKRITFQHKICLEISCMTNDIDNRSRSRLRTIKLSEKELFQSPKQSQPKQVVCKGNITAYCLLKEDKHVQENCSKCTTGIKSPECPVSVETGKPLCLLFKLSEV